MSETAELLEAVQEEARPATWTTGVALARAGTVALQSRGRQEVVFRVRAPGRPAPWTTILYLGDDAWECDCPTEADPCEHVVAAAYALHHAPPAARPPAPAARAPAARPPAPTSAPTSAPTAARPGAPLARPAPAAPGPRAPAPPPRAAAAAPRAAVPGAGKTDRLVYRLSRAEGGGLTFQRLVVRNDNTARLLERSLASVLAIPLEAARIRVEPVDHVVDRLLTQRPLKGVVPPDRLDGLLKALEPARNVLLGAQLVSISSERVLPRVVVEDRGADVVLTIDKDPRVSEVLAPGVALCGDVVCRLGETALTGPRLEDLPQVKLFPPANLGELTGKVLPELSRRFTVDVRSARVPRIDPTLKPRISLELEAPEGGLSVLPTLVYGAPPTVRIDQGRMVHLQGPVPVRDEPAEQKLLHSLRDQLNMAPGRRVTVHGKEAAQLADKLKRWRGGVTGEGARLVSGDAKLTPKLSLDAPPVPPLPGAPAEAGAPLPRVGFSFTFEVEGAGPGGPREVDGEAVVRAWKEGLGLVPLEGGGWAPLPEKWLRTHGQRVADLLAARDAGGKLGAHALPQLGELCEELEHPPPPGLERLAPLVQGFERLPDAPLPADLTASLRPYQKLGVSWLTFLRSAGLGGVLADDMGLGKTLQTICILGKGSLVVAPTSVLPNWEAEVKRFRPSLKVAVYHGAGRTLDPEADVTLTTYALLRLDAEALAERAWSTVVLDEAQAIKNPDSQVARAAYGLQADFRVALSGTPVENRLEELWSLMHFTNRGLLGGRRDFRERWEEPVAAGKKGAAEALRARIRPFVLRRLKRDVAPELPPRTESVLHVTLEERERAVYDAVFAATREEVVSMLDGGGSVMKALEALLRLRQAACHVGLVPGQTAKSSSKVKALLDALSQAVEEGHKALVFSQWTSLLDRVEPALQEAGLPFLRIDGSTSDRGGMVSRFQAADGPPVMLISLKAGATGLNLTAADHVFLLDPWWNPSVEAQAADRAHRIGQQRPVMVYRLVSQGTVEEKILALQAQKRALFEAALGGGEGGGAGGVGLTRDDLLQLLH
jgi:superfamily II DNA or RNA helicase